MVAVLFIIFILEIYFYLKLRLRYSLLKNMDTALCIHSLKNKIKYCNKKYKILSQNIAHDNNTSIYNLLSGYEYIDKLLYKLKIKALSGKPADTILTHPQKGSFFISAQNLNNDVVWVVKELDKDFDAALFSEDIFSLSDLPFPALIINHNNEVISYNDKVLSYLPKETDVSLGTLVKNSDYEKLNKFIDKIRSSTINNSNNIEIELAIGGQFMRMHIINRSERILLLFTEITKQKELEEKIGHGQKMQAVGQLAGGIAHDFNNILTAIVMSCDFLLSSHRSSDPSHPDLLRIKQNANRAAVLVQQLLAFSRRQTLKLVVSDMRDLISNTCSLVERLLGNNIKLDISYPDDLWNVNLDVSSFQNVLMNLIINAKDAIGENSGQIIIIANNLAAEYIPRGMDIQLSSVDHVVIEVIDNGMGMSAETIEKIFEPFFTTKSVGKGTGLGLAMAYGIIKQIGGTIECESTLGKGTKFSIYLPASKEISQPKKLITKPSVDISGNATILLVDDEEVVRKSFVRALKPRGYEILEASNGEKALELMRTHLDKINLVVSDVVMPEMDGVELYKNILQIKSDIKFAFISGYTRDAFSEKYNLSEDKFYFLGKPISLKELSSRVKEILNS